MSSLGLRFSMLTIVIRLCESTRQSAYCVRLGNIILQIDWLSAKHTVVPLWVGLVNLPCPGVGNEDDSKEAMGLRPVVTTPTPGVGWEWSFPLVSCQEPLKSCLIINSSYHPH